MTYTIYEQARSGLVEVGTVEADDSCAAIQAGKRLTQYPITKATEADCRRLGVHRAELPR